MAEPKFKRILLKVSGEGLGGVGNKGIDGDALEKLAKEIISVVKVGSQVGVVCGGGNIVRGAELAQEGKINQASADYMGMLGTVVNGIAIKEMLEKLGQPARVLSAVPIADFVAEPIGRDRAIRHFEEGRVVIFSGGTGAPFVTTDSAAALRACENECDVVLKATKVDGVYDKDPNKFSDAKRFDSLTFQQAIEKQLKIMDLGAFQMCRSKNVAIIVYDLMKEGNSAKVAKGEVVGTFVHNEGESRS